MLLRYDDFNGIKVLKKTLKWTYKVLTLKIIFKKLLTDIYKCIGYTLSLLGSDVAWGISILWL